MPVKDSHTRITAGFDQRPTANGHGRYMTATPERTFFPLEDGRHIHVSIVYSRPTSGAFHVRISITMLIVSALKNYYI
jgi:hypothetical protein